MDRPADVAVMIVCGLALVAAMTVAQAQGLPDPTRPPAFVDRPADAAVAGATPASAGVQTIIQRHNATSGSSAGAVVNGEYVVVGGKVGDAKVIDIGEDSVTLKGAAGKETLELIPGIKKAPVGRPGEVSGAAEPGRAKARKKVKR